MHAQYFTFLYNECKRLSAEHVNSDEIRQFINSPDGRRGFKAFCAQKTNSDAQSRPKHIKNLLENNNNE